MAHGQRDRVSGRETRPADPQPLVRRRVDQTGLLTTRRGTRVPRARPRSLVPPLPGRRSTSRRSSGVDVRVDRRAVLVRLDDRDGPLGRHVEAPDRRSTLEQPKRQHDLGADELLGLPAIDPMTNLAGRRMTLRSRPSIRAHASQRHVQMPRTDPTCDEVGLACRQTREHRRSAREFGRVGRAREHRIALELESVNGGTSRPTIPSSRWDIAACASGTTPPAKASLRCASATDRRNDVLPLMSAGRARRSRCSALRGAHGDLHRSRGIRSAKSLTRQSGPFARTEAVPARSSHGRNVLRSVSMSAE